MADPCEKCEGTGIHILADVPGEGRICGGRCPNGCPRPPLSLEERRDLWRAFPPDLQAQVRRMHPDAAAELDAPQEGPSHG